MSNIPTVSEVRAKGEFDVIDDSSLHNAIIDAYEDVDEMIARRQEIDPTFLVSGPRIKQLVTWRACETCAVTERRLQSESGAGLSGTYQGTQGQFKREFARVWARVCKGVTALDGGLW